MTISDLCLEYCIYIYIDRFRARRVFFFLHFPGMDISGNRYVI